MSFNETVPFPTKVSFTTRGGPKFDTTVVDSISGHDFRNSEWTYPLHEYNVLFGNKRRREMEELNLFFMAHKGRWSGFRFKDWVDYKSGDLEDDLVTDTDQTIGVGDNAETQYQLIKTYTVGTLSLVRNIYKPVAGTVVIALDGVPQGAGWTVNTTTGVITFSSAPGTSVVITAGYHFDVPCHFVEDKLNIMYDQYDDLNADVPIEEMRIAPTL